MSFITFIAHKFIFDTNELTIPFTGYSHARHLIDATHHQQKTTMIHHRGVLAWRTGLRACHAEAKEHNRTT
jgi:hypothetical protein